MFVRELSLSFYFNSCTRGNSRFDNILLLCNVFFLSVLFVRMILGQCCEKLCLYWYRLLFLGQKHWEQISTKKIKTWKQELFKVSNNLVLLCSQNVAVVFFCIDNTYIGIYFNLALPYSICKRYMTNKVNICFKIRFQDRLVKSARWGRLKQMTILLVVSTAKKVKVSLWEQEWI